MNYIIKVTYTHINRYALNKNNINKLFLRGGNALVWFSTSLSLALERKDFLLVRRVIAIATNSLLIFKTETFH